MRTIFNTDYLDAQEVAAELGVRVSTLAQWRTRLGWGPAYLKLGGKVMYERTAVQAYVSSQQRQPRKKVDAGDA